MEPQLTLPSKVSLIPKFQNLVTSNLMRLKRTCIQVLCLLMLKMIKAANFDVLDLVQTGHAISWACEFILSQYSSIVQSWAAILATLGLSILCIMLSVNFTQY